MKLFIIEGCHASGKTTLINKFKENNKGVKGVKVLDENFYTIDNFECGTQLHQFQWLMNWVNKLKELNKTKVDVVISDRGPLSSIIYNGDKFKHIADEIFKYLIKEGIEIKTIYLKSPEKEEHLKRIIQRSGTLVEKELKYLDEILELYTINCKNFISISSYEELIDIMNFKH